MQFHLLSLDDFLENETKQTVSISGGDTYVQTFSSDSSLLKKNIRIIEMEFIPNKIYRTPGNKKVPKQLVWRRRKWFLLIRKMHGTRC